MWGLSVLEMFFFFKQKTAYEMRISDWSSDVCSSDLRFFNHLITAMQTPSVIGSIERDIDAGDAAVIQIVSTGEALQERRLAEIPADEWTDVSVNITSREYVLDYLQHSFPVQLYEPCEYNAGSLSSRPSSEEQTSELPSLMST